MKIINKENGIEKVYVQLNDIMELIQTNKPIPASIIDNLFGIEMPIIDESNRDDFVKFEKKEEVDFFKSIEWIVDYKKYRNISKEDLKTLIKETTKEINNIANEYNNLSFSEKENQKELYDRYNMLSLKNEAIKKIYFMKTGEYKLDFPLVPDSDGFSLSCDDQDNPYKLSISLDPSIYLLYRTDGKKLNDKEGYPAHFIQTGLSLAFIERNDLPQTGDCELSFNQTEDNSYLMIKLNIIDKTNREENIIQPQEKGFRKVINKIFKRKK